MKKPKVDRFDPKPSTIKPEEVDLSGVPEIRSKSSKSASKRTEPAQKQAADSPKVSTTKKGTEAVQPTDRPDGSTPVRPTKRIRVRYAFEFYQDQILKLKEMRRTSISNEDEKEFSMSEYVRNALDDKLEGK